MAQSEAVFPANRQDLYEKYGYAAAVRSGDLLVVSGQVGFHRLNQFTVRRRPFPSNPAKSSSHFGLNSKLRLGDCRSATGRI